MANILDESLKFRTSFEVLQAYEWATTPATLWRAPETPSEYLYPLFQIWDNPWLGIYSYMVDKLELDPIIPDLKDFFGNITSWVQEKWSNLWAGLEALNVYIESLWNSIVAGLDLLGQSIKDEIMGLVNFISNIYTWLMWNLVDNIGSFVAEFFRPITDAWHSVTDTLALWFENIWAAITAFLASPFQWILDLAGDLWTWLLALKNSIWDSVIEGAAIVGAYIKSYLEPIKEILALWLQNIRDAITAFLGSPIQWVLDLAGDLWAWLLAIKDSIWDSVTEASVLIGEYVGTHLRTLADSIGALITDLLQWMWADIKATYGFVANDLIPAVADATIGALGWLKDEFVNIMGLAYNEIMDYARSFSPMTPEKSVDAAKILFGVAVGFGALAHGMALAVEAMPNVKYMGVHYLSAFVARMGSFGLISSATMGVIAALAIREPFSYYMKSLLRPTQPRELDLQIMAVKPDIPIETFRKGMAYQGYSDYWIDAIERTMFHEPSYFEMSMLGEDEVATTEWLFTKARRSGYTEVDAKVFVSSMIKKVTRDQRKEFYKQVFNAYKEGYMTRDDFIENLDALDFRPEGKELSIIAADMAYQFDLVKELITTYKKAFQDDMITEAEFRASLSALGVTEERVESMVDLEWTRKEPKILKAERKEFEKEWRAIQNKYSQLYLAAFRKRLISEQELVTYLTLIGIEERAAGAIGRLEAVKLVPKPKGVEIILPYIPAPPAMPVYEV